NWLSFCFPRGGFEGSSTFFRGRPTKAHRPSVRDFTAPRHLCHHHRGKPGKCAFRVPTQAQELRRVTHEPTIGTCISPVSFCVIVPIETYLTEAFFDPIPDSMGLTRSNNTFK